MCRFSGGVYCKQASVGAVLRNANYILSNACTKPVGGRVQGLSRAIHTLKAGVEAWELEQAEREQGLQRRCVQVQAGEAALAARKLEASERIR